MKRTTDRSSQNLEVANLRLKALQRSMAQPSEPRRRKRPAHNPHAHRPGRGQTTTYRAAKVADATLVVKSGYAAEFEIDVRTRHLDEQLHNRFTSSNYWKDH